MRGLKLESLLVENFRSISGRWEIPLDAQTILIHGPNGAGKTSILSAIELAAAGSVGFLDEPKRSLAKVLLHRSFPLGEVELRLRDETGQARVGRFALDRQAVRGTGALEGNERTTFLERCFLPQTALGRLLETYTTSSKQIETSLVRFVKSIVGLDDLDNLIDGLDSAGHVARTKSLSPDWRANEVARQELETKLNGLRGEREKLENMIAEGVSELRQLASASLETVPDDEVATSVLTELRANTNSTERLSHLESIRVRLDGLTTAIEQGFAQALPGSDSDNAMASARATAQLEEWERSSGQALLFTLNAVLVELGREPATPSTISEAFEEARETLARANAAALELQRIAQERRQQQDRLQADLERAEAGLAEVRTQIEAISVPSDARELIELLGLASTAASSDDCPVCDRQFPGGHAALSSHITGKLALLTESASLLISAQRRLSGLEQQRVELRTALGLLDSSEDHGSAQSDYSQLTRQLNSIEERVRAGEAHLRAVRASLARGAELAARQSARKVADQRLMELRNELGLATSELEAPEELHRLRHVLEEQIQAAQFEATRRERSSVRARQTDEYSARRAVLDAQIEQGRSDIAQIASRLREAERRKKAANDLRLEAQRTRSTVINEVFDSTLNGLWADLFTRFVPTEPYVPRFKKQTASNRGRSRTVDVELETALPDGTRSAAPSAVLSYGNTNTAALSLFLALHLSAPDDVPWLIFDDPVQSMDDIHISNFAAVVRQLTVHHNRQLVIAVHQRELFDYLALELAPASSGQSLIKISLERYMDTTDISVERVQFAPEKPLLQISQPLPQRLT